MFCSTIIPTIGRPTLERAVCSVLEQDFTEDDFEVIVVNDSGSELAPAAWQKAPRVRIITTNRRERSVARNTGAAVAKGEYLHFLDDDDWLLPGALARFWSVARETKAAWIYGGTRLEDGDGTCFAELDLGRSGNCFTQVMAGEWIALQASLIDAGRFFAVGGFNPLMPATQDVDLSRRVALRGDFERVPHNAACVLRGPTWKTVTDYRSGAEKSRLWREGILDQPGTFRRLLGSADSPYWKGRVVRVYWTSAIWNWEHKRLFVGISRLLFGAAALLVAGPSVVSKDFARALARPHTWTARSTVGPSVGI